MNDPLFAKEDKPKLFSSQQKNPAEQKKSVGDTLPDSNRRRSKSKFSRAELKEKADIIRATDPWYSNLSNNGQVLVIYQLIKLSVEYKSEQFYTSVERLARLTGLSHRYTQTCLKGIDIQGQGFIRNTPVKLKNPDGTLSWKNDPRGNLITLLPGFPKPPVHPIPVVHPRVVRPIYNNKKILVVENNSNSSEPMFNEKNGKKGFDLSPELEYEIDTLPATLTLGKIKDKMSQLLNLSNNSASIKQQIKNYVAQIIATAANINQAETLNRMIIQGIREDKEQMMVGNEPPRTVMGIFSIIAKLKTSTGGIKNPAAYLIGYLRKPRHEQRGYQSLAALVKIMPSAPIVDQKIQQAIEPATMHDGVFVRSQQLFKQIEPWRPMPESKKELVGRFNAFWGEIMGDCHPMAKKDLTDRHGQWAIPIVLSVRLSNLLRKKDGSAPIRSELAYIKHLSKKDSLDNPLPYVDAVLAKAGVDLVVAGIQTAATKTNESPGSERCRRARAPEQNFRARKFPPSAIGDFFEAAATHQPLDADEMKKFSAKIKTAVSEVKEKREP